MPYENIAVPFQTIGNTQCLTDQQIAEQPYLKEFMDRFPLCFERDEVRQLWRFYLDGATTE